MQLHDPYAAATPSQRYAAEERNKRLAKIKAKAKPDKPVIIHIPQFVEPVPALIPDRSLERWTERQKRIPLPKKPWFSVERDLGPIEAVRPSVEQIQRAVCLHYNVKREDFLSIRRFAAVVKARQVAMYLCKVLTLRTLPEIGRRMGGRDHTTVLHGFRKVERLITSDLDLAAEIESIRAGIAV